MKPLFVINDVHLGALRSGGTTTASAAELRKRLLVEYAGLLQMGDGCNLLINGDLFDATNIPLTDLFSALQTTINWLEINPSSTLYLPPGNHDLSKNSEIFSSFDFFAYNLRVMFPNRVVVPRELMRVGLDMWVIPHMPNQDLFDLELAKITSCEYLFLHCNYDNGFAAQSDHSLNLSKEQAMALPALHIVIAHEHQRKEIGTGIHIVGNQIPSSVADCLGNDRKYAVRIDDSGLQWVQTWDSQWNFARLDWRDLAAIDNTSTDFVRVEGTAAANEAAQVIERIAKFRQRSSSLVITNAVEIEGASIEQMDVSLEQIQSFNVLAELLAFLDEDQRVVVQNLLENGRV